MDRKDKRNAYSPVLISCAFSINICGWSYSVSLLRVETLFQFCCFRLQGPRSGRDWGGIGPANFWATWPYLWFSIQTYPSQKTKRSQKRDFFKIPDAFPAIEGTQISQFSGEACPWTPLAYDCLRIALYPLPLQNAATVAVFNCFRYTLTFPSCPILSHSTSSLSNHSTSTRDDSSTSQTKPVSSPSPPCMSLFTIAPLKIPLAQCFTTPSRIPTGSHLRE